MISLITRVQYPDLYRRMKESALDTAATEIEFLAFLDKEGLPRIAPVYNQLGAEAKGEILVFVHDDVMFLEQGWDARIMELFSEGDFNIAGVVGTTRYNGGYLVTEGHPHIFGKFVNLAGDELRVNIYGRKVSNVPMVAVDGMFMAVKTGHFENEKFDEKLDGLFFYDIDYCLRGRPGLVDVLIAHYKPKDRFGKYPAAMNPMSDYESYFYAKHGIVHTGKVGDVRSLKATLEAYQEIGHDGLWRMFEEKYLIHA